MTFFCPDKKKLSLQQSIKISLNFFFIQFKEKFLKDFQDDFRRIIIRMAATAERKNHFSSSIMVFFISLTFDVNHYGLFSRTTTTWQVFWLYYMFSYILYIYYIDNVSTSFLFLIQSKLRDSIKTLSLLTDRLLRRVTETKQKKSIRVESIGNEEEPIDLLRLEIYLQLSKLQARKNFALWVNLYFTQSRKFADVKIRLS